MVLLCGLCCMLEIQCWCVRYLGVFAVVFAKLLWYLRLKNQTYAEILEYSILHRFGFERGGCGCLTISNNLERIYEDWWFIITIGWCLLDWEKKFYSLLAPAIHNECVDK